MKLLIWIIVICVFCFAVWMFLIRCRNGNAKLIELRKYRYAHRGFHDKPLCAENSLSAFRRAIEHGFGAELDVHLMADGNLAVIHDSSLKRTCGVDIKIEDLTLADLPKYKLEESDDIIPLFDEVLELFEQSGLPLIVEVKVERNDYEKLCEKTYEKLKNYKGKYCMESFDPRAVTWFKKNAPDVVRGQLSTNFVKGDSAGMGKAFDFVLTNCMMNFLAVPDFIAYEFEHRKQASLRLARKIWGVQEVNWTIRKNEDLKVSEQDGCIPIFETFDPEE